MKNITNINNSKCRNAITLSLYESGFFFTFGIFLPYFPKWLNLQNFGTTQIGLILLVWLWGKGFSSPIIGWLVQIIDKRGRVASLLALVTTVVIACFLTFNINIYLFLLLVLIFSLSFPPAIPLGDEMIMRISRNNPEIYGKVRLWGSISFFVSNLFAGYLFNIYGIKKFPHILLIASFIFFTTTLLLPTNSKSSIATQKANKIIPTLFSKKYKTLWALILTGALIEASHAAYYGYSTIYWMKNNFSPLMIGFLWAEAVIAEVIAFSNSEIILKHLSVSNLYAIAALSAIIRWTVTSLSPSYGILLTIQLLHGFSFGFAHLATIVGIRKFLQSDDLTSTAYGINMFITSSIFTGCATLVASFFYKIEPNLSFLSMGGFALIGLFFSQLFKSRYKTAQI